MSYKITGTIVQLTPAQTLKSKSGNDYTKRDLVIAVRMFDQYTGQPIDDSNNTPKFTFIGDRCKDLDQFKVGDVVTVSFDVNGRSYQKEGKIEYITDIRPYKVGIAKASNNQQLTPQQAPQVAQTPTNAPQELSDELPF